MKFAKLSCWSTAFLVYVLVPWRVVAPPSATEMAKPNQ